MNSFLISFVWKHTIFSNTQVKPCCISRPLPFIPALLNEPSSTTAKKLDLFWKISNKSYLCNCKRACLSESSIVRVGYVCVHECALAGGFGWMCVCVHECAWVLGYLCMGVYESMWQLSAAMIKFLRWPTNFSFPFHRFPARLQSKLAN